MRAAFTGSSRRLRRLARLTLLTATHRMTDIPVGGRSLTLQPSERARQFVQPGTGVQPGRSH